MTPNRKPCVLIVTDSAHIDTGFGRVAREVGTRLVLSGDYRVVQFGWFHMPSTKAIPFQVIPTRDAGSPVRGQDSYGQQSYAETVARVDPDVVIVVGDVWMIRHIANQPRNHQLVAYVPIDSMPIPRAWAAVLGSVDHLVLYGPFGQEAVRQIAPRLETISIPHGVDTDVFYPMSPEAKAVAKAKLFPNVEDPFVVGCVARNQTRKMLPRLVEAFKWFIRPATTCNECGYVVNQAAAGCVSCGSMKVTHFDEKKRAMLYLHTVADDPEGWPLKDLIIRHGLKGRVGVPSEMAVGRGCDDESLNEIYNAMDLFTLPTGGEGWGLPILEAMSAGLPTLCTHYSAHVDYMQEGAGEFIAINTMITDTTFNLDRAVVDIDDYVIKLDRFYYPHDKFLMKWAKYFVNYGGFDPDDLGKFIAGPELLDELGRSARGRALEYTWDEATDQWRSLLNKITNGMSGKLRSADALEILH